MASSLTLLYFSIKPQVSLYSKKQNTCFREFYTCFWCETKTEVVRILFIFEIDLCSAPSMESSCRELLNDVAKHRSILKKKN